MSDIDTTILTDVRVYAQKLRDTLKNVVLQMQAEVKKRDSALTEEDQEAARIFQDKLHASADEADALVKELEPHVPRFLTQPYPEFAGSSTTAASREIAVVEDNTNITNTGGTRKEADARSSSADDVRNQESKARGSGEHETDGCDSGGQDGNKKDEDEELSAGARAIIEGFKRLTGGRPDPRMGWGIIPDKYK